MLKPAALILCALLACNTNAQRTAGMRGAGSVACGTYLADRASGNPNQSIQYSTYAQGYLSGYNTHSTNPELREVPTTDTIAAYLDRYCRDNPLDIVRNGIDMLIRDLGGYSAPYLKSRK
ncbi:hypothetical protein [Variovorax gossypii]